MVERSPTNGPVTFILGCVDSGASRTLLPLSAAHRLGLDPGELVKDPGSSGGVGSTFDTWSSTIPILGTVAAYLKPGKGRPEPWGKPFKMNPAFTDLQPEPASLLGRADFFKAFCVEFWEDDAAPRFVIRAL